MANSASCRLFWFTVMFSSVMAIGLSYFTSMSQASPTATPSPEYSPPARETPLRTDSAGVRLNEEKGISSVTQNTIAIERPIPYNTLLTPLIETLERLIPNPQILLTPKPAQQLPLPQKS